MNEQEVAKIRDHRTRVDTKHPVVGLECAAQMGTHERVGRSTQRSAGLPVPGGPAGARLTVGRAWLVSVCDARANLETLSDGRRGCTHSSLKECRRATDPVKHQHL